MTLASYSKELTLSFNISENRAKGGILCEKLEKNYKVY